MSLLAPDDSYTTYAHGSPSDGFGARLQWRYSTKLYEIGTATAGGELSLQTANKIEAVRIDDAGLV